MVEKDLKYLLSTPKLTISSTGSLKIGSQFNVVVNIGELSGDLNFLAYPIEVWMSSTEHFQFKDEKLKRLFPEEIKRGLLEVSFRVEVVNATKIYKPQLIAYFSYRGRPSGKVERCVDISA